MTRNKHRQNERQMRAPPKSSASRGRWLRFAKLRRNVLGWLQKRREDVALYLRSRLIPAAKRVLEFGKGVRTLADMKRIGRIFVLVCATAAFCQNAYGRGSTGSLHSSSHHSSNYHGRSSSSYGAYHGYRSSGSHRDSTTYSDGASGVQRDSHGRIKRSEEAKDEFKRRTGYPHGRPGYVIDHIIPLKRGGSDTPDNMQWQTIQAAKQKDKTE